MSGSNVWWVYLPVSYRPFLVRLGDVTYIAIPHVVVSLRFPKTPSITSDIYSTSTRAPELRNGGRNLRCCSLSNSGYPGILRIGVPCT